MLEEILIEGFRRLNLPLSELQLGSFRKYRDFLAKTNKVMNLTAITDEDDVAKLHFLDCASLLSLYDFKDKSLIDVGTGAGFPGMVLKIAEPSITLTLLDSLDKRIGFLNESCKLLNIENVQCIHARAEELDSTLREQFDVVSSRAVAKLNVLCEICLPYVKLGGVFIAMKGPEFDEELEEAKKCIRELGGKTEKCEKYTIPGTDITHSAIIIRKVKNSPEKYPRRWAQIKKLPL